LLFYRLYDWQTMNRKDIRDILKAQAPNTQLEFEHRTKEVIVQFAVQVSMQLVVCLFVGGGGGGAPPPVCPSGVGAPPVGLRAVTPLDAAVTIFKLVQIAIGTDACLHMRAHTNSQIFGLMYKDSL
jgi:hypothetical protein